MVLLRLIRRTICHSSSVFRTKSIKPETIRLYYKKPEVESGQKGYATYEGDGKTVGFIINKKSAQTILIGSVTTEGFIMASGAEIIGSLMLFPHSILSWHVTTAQDVNEDSLTLLKVVEPKIDILVFGYGTNKDYTPEVRQRFTQICKKLGVRFEALPTTRAVGLFNFLADERRFVAGALIPPSAIDKFAFDRSKDLSLEDGLEDLEALPVDTQARKLLK